MDLYLEMCDLLAEVLGDLLVLPETLHHLLVALPRNPIPTPDSHNLLFLPDLPLHQPHTLTQHSSLLLQLVDLL